MRSGTKKAPLALMSRWRARKILTKLSMVIVGGSPIVSSVAPVVDGRSKETAALFLSLAIYSAVLGHFSQVHQFTHRLGAVTPRSTDIDCHGRSQIKLSRRMRYNPETFFFVERFSSLPLTCIKQLILRQRNIQRKQFLFPVPDFFILTSSI